MSNIIKTTFQKRSNTIIQNNEDNKTENNYSKKIFDFLNKNEIFNRYTSEFANKGLII